MSLSLASLPPDAAAVVRGKIFSLLVASKYMRPKLWHTCVVCMTPEGDRVMSRAELADGFRAAGDLALAHEILRRRVEPRSGAVLLWVVTDDDRGAFGGLTVVNLREGLR